MKLRDITNSKCDVRKYMSIEVSDEARYELENWDYDVDDVLSQACISVDGHKLDDEITPFNVEKYLELNENQQIVLEWLKKKYKTTDIEPIELIWRLRVNSNSDKWRLQPPYKNYRYLTEMAQFQVLAAFAEWGKEEGTE